MNHRISVEAFIRDSRDFQQGSEEAAILFADLVGSTEFKRDHSALQGLAKTVLHNEVARSAITRCGGQVVKYIGDGVMGIFQGPDARNNALKAGLAAISGMDEANKSHGWDFPQAMSTRVGVHFGKIWMFQYAEATVSDPQGTTVDIAARLASIGGPQQLVCTDDDFTRAGDVEACVSDVVKRFVKGVTKPLNLRILVPTGRHCDPHHLMGVPSPLAPEVVQGLRFMREGRTKHALDTFDAILKKDTGNFHANLYAGFLSLQNATDLAGIASTQEYLCAAKWARPHASRVWLLLSWLRYKQYELSKDLGSLDQAIRYVETAVFCAEDGINHEATIESKTYWARYLFQRSKETASSAPHDLAQAAVICAELAKVIEGSVPEHRLEYYVTHALILLASGDTTMASKMIEKAKTLDSQFAGVWEAQYELAKKTGKKNQGPGVLGG